MSEFERYIVPTELKDTNKQKAVEKEILTKDKIFLEALDKLSKKLCEERIRQQTDYAVMNGLKVDHFSKTSNEETAPSQWLRSSDLDSSKVDTITLWGGFYARNPSVEYIGVCPSTNVDASLMAIDKQYLDKISFETDVYGNILYHTIELGSYPQNLAKNSDELEKLFLRHSSQLTLTGKTYIGYMKQDGSFEQNFEYKYNGKKYVRVISKKHDEYSKFKDGTDAPETGTPVWAEVQPIKWKIQNWAELPKEINPNGNSSTTIMDLKAEKVLLPMSFYPQHGIDDKYHTSWQNSVIRAYLNGYDLHEEIKKGNGNKKYKTDKNFNFKGKGFLNEAFENELTNSFEIEEDNQNLQTPQKRKTRLEKLNPDTTPTKQRREATDTELIKSWVDAGQSVLLRGPSGIGKTERLKKLYPDLIYIKLTNNMFPEKVVGSMNLQTGQSIPPDFAKQALLNCATDEERKLINENIQNLYDLADTIYERSKNATGKTVILLDELLNVKPAVQSLVYTLVLNKIVETGKGLKLPANTVVVATGNQKKYSVVAEDLAEPLEKRFDHILDMEPKVGEWIYEYAIPNNVHPSVIGYIFSKYQQTGRSEDIDDIGYFYEEPEVGENNLDKNGCRGKTNDPRGWVSISNTLYAFEEDLQKGRFFERIVESILKTTLDTKLREEWAEEFFDFYNNPALTPEEVAEKRYTQVDLPTNINEKFALLASLLGANEKQVGACREFIRKHCDPEYLSVYDIYWAGNDETRMEKIAELEEISQIQLKDNGDLINE